MWAVRLLSTVALGFTVALSACSDGASGPGTDGVAAEDGTGSAPRLGRVHVLIEPAYEVDRAYEVDPDLDPDLDAFEITARFALVRGLDEEFVRARADIPFVPEEMLEVGQCASEEALWPSVPLTTEDAELGRELVLVDAGDFEVQVAGQRLEIPLALVPDLLPNMSGVEYGFFAEELPEGLEDAASLTVRAAGGMTDELPGFEVDGAIPMEIGLRSLPEDRRSLRDDALVVRWDASSSTALTLRLTPTVSGEPLGDDIYCVVSDVGQTRLDLGELRTLGFANEADAVQVSASRTSFTLFDVGEFAGTELLVERRASTNISLR